MATSGSVEPVSDVSVTVRGTLDTQDTARMFYTGRMGMSCHFEEFAFDTAFNRLLKAAACVVMASPLLDADLRRRGRSIVSRMMDVGPLRPTDAGVTVERRTAHYRDALGWARHVLLARGRALEAGTSSVWTFLIRTPELVEAGLRHVIAAAIGPTRVPDQGRRRQLHGSRLTFTPDVVVDHGAVVADVKYKIARGDWRREDLYQITTFATVFGSTFAAVIDFTPPGIGSASALVVGGIRLAHLPWSADPALPPTLAATDFVTRFGSWLTACANDRGQSCLQQSA